MASATVGPRVYVGTYAKHNAGNIGGAWLYLEDYADQDAFRAACLELHNDETDPELMFQDFDGFPRDYYSESGLSDDLWDWLALNADDRELLSIYRDHVADAGGIWQAREAFAGTYDSPAEWAERFLDDIGALSEVPANLRDYIDFDAYARDAGLGGDVVFVRTATCVWVFWANT